MFLKTLAALAFEGKRNWEGEGTNESLETDSMELGEEEPTPTPRLETWTRTLH